MEGNRTGADPVSPQPRRKVLRKGVRIVAEQFAPYDDGPDIEPSSFDLVSIIGAWKKSFTNFDTTLHSFTLYTAPQGGSILGDFKPPDLEPINTFDPGKAINKAGKPKKERQIEPFYVQLTKPKRR